MRPGTNEDDIQDKQKRFIQHPRWDVSVDLFHVHHPHTTSQPSIRFPGTSVSNAAHRCWLMAMVGRQRSSLYSPRRISILAHLLVIIIHSPICMWIGTVWCLLLAALLFSDHDGNNFAHGDHQHLIPIFSPLLFVPGFLGAQLTLFYVKMLVCWVVTLPCHSIPRSCLYSNIHYNLPILRTLNLKRQTKWFALPWHRKTKYNKKATTTWHLTTSAITPTRNIINLNHYYTASSQRLYGGCGLILICWPRPLRCSRRNGTFP